MAALLSKTLGVVCPTCDFLNVVGAVRCMACSSATEGPVVGTAATPRVSVEMRQDEAHPAGASPPGLRRSPSPTPPPRTATGSSPSAAVKRPPVTSSPSRQTPAQQQVVPRYGLTVLAGPARGQRFKLPAQGTQVGRAKGMILFPDDPFVSPHHASLTTRDGKLFVRDEGSTSGVFVSITGTETIPPNSYFGAGVRLFRYVGPLEPVVAGPDELAVYGAPMPPTQVHVAVEEILLGDRAGRCIVTTNPVLTVGQSKCDFSFPSDEGLAPRHCELAPLPSGALVRDLSGGLGTFIRIQGERALKPNDRLRIGQQTLQVEVLA